MHRFSIKRFIKIKKLPNIRDTKVVKMNAVAINFYLTEVFCNVYVFDDIQIFFNNNFHEIKYFV